MFYGVKKSKKLVMQKINLILKLIIKFFLFFLLAFIWIRFTLKSLWISILLSSLISVTVIILLEGISTKRAKISSLKIKEKEDAENMFLSLATSKDATSFFHKLASKKHEATKKKTYILIKHEEYNVILYPHTSFAPITPDDVTKILSRIQKENYTKLVVCCGEVSKEAISFVKNFETEILLLDKYQTYSELYKFYDCFPEITLSYKKTKKESFKDLLSFSFNRSRTKSYLFSAVILLFSSLFVRLNLYYAIFSSLLVIFAIISFFMPVAKTRQNVGL